MAITEKRAHRLANKCMEIFRQFCPVDTGNLAYNAVRLDFGDGYFRIYVDEDIAYYMPYTNEPWISPKWHGRKNPNVYWFDAAVEACMAMLAAELKGIIRKEDHPTEDMIRRDLENLSDRITYANYTPEDLDQNSLALSQRGSLATYEP